VLMKSVADRLIHALRMQAKRRKIRIAVRSLLWCSLDSSTDLRKFTAQAGPEIAQRHNENDRYQATQECIFDGGGADIVSDK